MRHLVLVGAMGGVAEGRALLKDPYGSQIEAGTEDSVRRWRLGVVDRRSELDRQSHPLLRVLDRRSDPLL